MYEAMINRFGENLFTVWGELESLSTMSKTKVIYDKIDLEFDIGQRPLQMINELFKFRNFAAHGKTKEFAGKTELPKDVDQKFIFRNIDEFFPVKQKRFCNQTNFERVVEDIKKVEELIDKKSTLDCCPLSVSGVTSFSIIT